MTSSNRQLELELDRPMASATGGSRGLLYLAGRVLFWAPVWMPLGFLALVSLRGLVPALEAGEKLEQDEQEMEQRIQGLLAERDELERDFAKLEDPIFRERLRRSLEQAEVEPLRLRRDRATSTSREAARVPSIDGDGDAQDPRSR